MRASKRKHVPDNPNPTTSSSILESGDEEKVIVKGVV